MINILVIFLLIIIILILYINCSRHTSTYTLADSDSDSDSGPNIHGSEELIARVPNVDYADHILKENNKASKKVKIDESHNQVFLI
jgi:hypothetical protein